MLRNYFLVFLLLGAVCTSAVAQDITLAWDPSSSPGVTGYKLYYRTKFGSTSWTGAEAATPSATEGNSPVDVGNVTSATLTGLESGVVYLFAVLAYDAEGYHSRFSNIISSSTVGKMRIDNQQPHRTSIGVGNGRIKF